MSVAGVGIAESAPAIAALSNKIGSIILRNASSELGLLRTGASIFTKNYGGALVGATLSEGIKKGGDSKQIDAFDILTSTAVSINGISEIVGVSLLNSAIDMKVISGEFNKVGSNKNFKEASLDFIFGLFGESVKFSMATMGALAQRVKP